MSSSNLAVISAGCAAPGPCPFANNIVFTTPFLYNRANGPLLIDLQLTNLQGSGTGEFDEINCPNTSCVINGVFAESLGAATGTVEGGSFILQITYTLASTQCDTFTDVLATDSSCPAVQWLKNRQVTLGCTSATQYCPSNNVTRAQMALFMNRLGKVLSPEILSMFGQPGVVTIPSAPPFITYCQTSTGRSWPDLARTVTAAITAPVIKCVTTHQDG